ncbi:unnamed protein product [Cylicocyclus nassatus]|uniref:Cyclin N-terminal domain-containing protein n=1 Tax=Cylicocyclus nassatus TaxID=53992 RepID=A0AA36GN92_CYLNA|nr:unnamed protein product [Cylicocyclus nassatus]
MLNLSIIICFAYDVAKRSNKIILDFERYCNEFSRDTYHWLCYRESTVHAIGMSFLAAQKLGGVTETVRKTAVMKAIIEMRKMGYAAESIHLGAYIMDKCLDSFHVACQALPDVCAVSMVLGTKIEEYESLRPGTLNGLAGASRNKKRLCHIEKRIIHELASGLCFPTPLVLANFMLAHLHSNEEQARFVHYLLDLAVLESRFRDEAGARLAHAAVCISAAVVDDNKVRNSECRALVEAEHRLSNFTQMLCGSTRDVMRELIIEMEKAVDEKNAVLVEYLAEDSRRVCYSEVSPALWNFIFKDSHIRIHNDKESESILQIA